MGEREKEGKGKKERERESQIDIAWGRGSDGEGGRCSGNRLCSKVVAHHMVRNEGWLQVWLP